MSGGTGRLGEPSREADRHHRSGDRRRRSVGALAGFGAETVRLGVTGLSRAGKTVFITALVRNLLGDGRLPFFRPHAEGRLAHVYLEPQPDDTVPRFSYEEHLALLAADTPTWPEGTRRLSQLRLTFDYAPAGFVRRTLMPAFGLSRLHLDIIDYPGEWLIDLAMLDASFAKWSEQALATADAVIRREAAREFLTFIATLDAAQKLDETVAQKGTDSTAAISNARARKSLTFPPSAPAAS